MRQFQGNWIHIELSTLLSFLTVQTTNRTSVNMTRSYVSSNMPSMTSPSSNFFIGWDQGFEWHEKQKLRLWKKQGLLIKKPVEIGFFPDAFRSICDQDYVYRFTGLLCLSDTFRRGRGKEGYKEPPMEGGDLEIVINFLEAVKLNIDHHDALESYSM